MAKNYFKLTDDMSRPDRWLLGDPIDEQGKEVRGWRFMNGEPTRFDGCLRIPVYHPGSSLDFTRVDTGGFPVVTEKVARVLAELAPGDVQLFPAEVESRSETYFVVNVARRVKCIDEAASAEVRYGEPEDNWPDELGYYEAVYGMRIDPCQVGEAKVFRPWGYTGSLLVAEDVKEALERTGATGLAFTEVTGPSPISEEERAYKQRCRELLDPPPAARRAVWKTLGTLDELAVAPRAICYEWPGHRQDWAIIHREAGRLLLVSEGLSDPFIARLEPSVGFGLELALETEPAELPLGSIEESWPYMLLARVAREVVANERVREQAKAGLFSLEVSGKGLPDSLVTPEGRVGVLLGVESRTLPRRFSTPFGEVQLVTVKALLPSELEYVVRHAPEGPAELARRFAESGEEHVSRARRR
ncbi:imm11 family protein [Cystobacter ferrugineus]|uniref:Immunity MXAN-0049 protein domain-containing protein n=1 Tax=Cystobacter ferrugineus TaxID=83449 RepID=A0A1L9AV86_9BACT|nr:DUF1629 domain-containing protein [Cystobacter ferrugineus]OJH33921.1 hypothetical protein BON30_46195 [Cystobacter ferrugineus]